MSLKYVFAAALFAVATPALAQQPLSTPTQGAVRSACAGDVQSLCPSVKPGEGRIVKCLAENRAKISVACKVAMADAQLERQAREGAKSGAK